MIQSLDDIIKNSNIESMIDGKLCYEESIPYTSEELIYLAEDSYILMQYLEGSISRKKYSNNEFVRNIYDKYIFNKCDVFSHEFVIDEKDIDDLIKFRMLLSPESPYMERFSQLMIRICFEYNRNQLTGLVQSMLEKDTYDWAKEYIRRYQKDRQSILFQQETGNYKMLFGMTEESSDKKGNPTNSENIKTVVDEEDWILQRFGG